MIKDLCTKKQSFLLLSGVSFRIEQDNTELMKVEDENNQCCSCIVLCQQSSYLICVITCLTVMLAQAKCISCLGFCMGVNTR